jgi:hypothetical protein
VRYAAGTAQHVPTSRRAIKIDILCALLVTYIGARFYKVKIIFLLCKISVHLPENTDGD